MTSVTAFQSTLPVRGATRTAGEYQITKEFQSTLPVRGATKKVGAAYGEADISIHAPRAGSDMV